MAVTVKVTGGDKYKAFLAKMGEIAGSVRAGIFADATNATTGEKIAHYAIYNEFGTSRIPPRPFMRTVAKSDAPKQWIGGMVRFLKGRAADPEAWRTALGGAGEQMVKDIQNSIQNGSWTPNAPATVKAKARKGKTEPDHPLIDTGDMLRAVRSEVSPR